MTQVRKGGGAGRRLSPVSEELATVEVYSTETKSQSNEYVVQNVETSTEQIVLRIKFLKILYAYNATKNTQIIEIDKTVKIYESFLLKFDFKQHKRLPIEQRYVKGKSRDVPKGLIYEEIREPLHDMFGKCEDIFKGKVL